MKKVVTSAVLATSMVMLGMMPAVSAMAMNSPEGQEQATQAGNIQKITIDKTALKKVTDTSSKMDNYIKLGTDNQLHLDAAAKKVVSNDVYQTYQQGVDRLNQAIREKQIVIQNGKPALPQTKRINSGMSADYTYSNPYWWGLAITFDEPDTKQFIHFLNNSGVGWSAAAGIAGLIPGAQAASAASVIVAAGCFLVANNMSYYDNGRGVTLNVHWIPTGYVSCNSN